jgi:hypothetical protein
MSVDLQPEIPAERTLWCPHEEWVDNMLESPIYGGRAAESSDADKLLLTPIPRRAAKTSKSRTMLSRTEDDLLLRELNSAGGSLQADKIFGRLL